MTGGRLKEVALEDKPLFDAYLQKGDVQASELTFANLFLWREHYGFRHMMAGDCLVVIACGPAEPFALPPLGLEHSAAPDAALSELAALFARRGLPARIERADDRVCAALEGLGIAFRAERDRANDDYLYLTEDLCSLKGRKYDGKRNHIRRLMAAHEVEYREVTAENLPAASQIFSEWFSQRGRMDEAVQPEWKACRELFANYEALGCRGILMLVDGEPAAAAFGEKLNGDTAVIHFEKAVRWEDGAYPSISHSFAERAWRDMTFINREQDLGLPGLRQSKLSWHPARLVEKYRITFPAASN